MDFDKTAKRLNSLSEKDFLKRTRRAGFLTEQELSKELYPDKKEREAVEKEIDRLAKQYAEEYKCETAAKLKKARLKAKMTQADLAKKVGTSVPAISRIEHGKQNLTMERILSLATATEQPFKLTITVPGTQNAAKG